MQGRHPDAPDWEVRLHWLRRARLRRWARGRPERRSGARTRERGSWLDWLDPFAFADEGCLPVLAAVAAIVAVAVLIVFGGPLLVLLVEQVLLVVIAVLGIVARVLFRRPWTVEARYLRDDARTVRYPVVGLRRALAARHEIRRAIERAGAPPARLADP